MFINFFHGLLHPVESGWDPISPAYAKEYDEVASREMHRGVAEKLSALSNGLAGKTVLDLGGGPGHYSVLLAQLGARVIWHDPSREYQKIAEIRAQRLGVSLQFSLGYLEDAKKFGADAFDIIFCRVCWYYCRSDRAFARLLYKLLKPGGVAYIECNITPPPWSKWIRRLQSWLNKMLWLKIGHPLPPRGRIAKLFHGYQLAFMEVDYRSQEKDFVIFKKSLDQRHCGSADEKRYSADEN